MAAVPRLRLTPSSRPIRSRGRVWTCIVTPNDGHVNGTPGQASVTILNSPPVAEAGDGQTVNIITPVTLDGGGSSDADGGADITGYAWTQAAGDTTHVTLSGANTVTASFTPTVAGVYHFTLTVTDGSAASGTDTVTIDVNNPNHPPVLISLGVSPDSGYHDTTFTYSVQYSDMITTRRPPSR